MTKSTITDKLRTLNHDIGGVSDLQSDSDLDSIRNSCDVCDSYCAWTLVISGMGGGGGSMVRDICLAYCNLLQEISQYFVMIFCELEKRNKSFWVFFPLLEETINDMFSSLTWFVFA